MGDLKIIDDFARVRRALHIIYTQALSGTNLGPLQSVIIQQMAVKEPISPSDLAREVGVDPAAITRAADCMVQNELIVKKQDEGDRRRFVLSLSAKGRKLVPQLQRIREDLEEQLLEPLSVSERRVFASLQRKIREGLEDRAHR